LVELLVVLACIAALLAILLPVTGTVRRQAKAVACLSNLRQLGQAFLVYADGNNGRAPAASCQWQPVLGLISYERRNALLFCPRATRFGFEGSYDTLSAYYQFSMAFHQIDYLGYGSYGLNGWVCDPPLYLKTNPRGLATVDHWRQVAVEGAGNVPLFLDALWIDAYPSDEDNPPPLESHVPDLNNLPAWAQYQKMGTFCINRHDGFVNCVLLDFSARKVGLRELWTLKWHRRFNTGAPAPDWPEWMRNLPAP
jgi:type II secretory pathway pseudopilin PulG